MPDQFEIERTGLPALRFTGDRIAEANSREHDGPLQNRWHELTLFRTAGGQLVWAAAYHSRWQGEHTHHEAAITTEAGVVSALTADYDPLAHYAGYPAGDHYADKDRRQREAVRRGYLRAVSDLLGQADIAEEVA